jgi:hypothetical protein
MRWGNAHLCFAVIMVGVGCTTGHDLIVDLKTDLVPGVEFEAVRTELLGGGIFGRMTAAGMDDDFLEGARVALFEGVDSGNQVVRMTLLDGEGRRVQDEVLIVDVSTDVGVTVVVSRDCRGVTCPASGDEPSETACLGGRCVDPRCSVETPELCGSPECTSDGDCMVSAPCASARCELGACFTVADASDCGAGEWCNPDVGCEPLPVGPPGDGGTDAGADALVDAGPARGPVVEYRFDEGMGMAAGDAISPPLDLMLGPNTTWTSDAIRVTGDTTISHAGAASKVADACRASGGFTFEAWVTPAAPSGEGRLLALAAADGSRWVGIRQSGSQWSAGIDTSMGDDDSHYTGSGTTPAELTHLVYTRFASGELAWYLDDDRRVWTGTLGDLGEWPADLALEIATPGDATETSFLGDIHYVALYDRGMPREEVRAHLAAGPP